MTKTFANIIIITILLSGCNSLKKECEDTDWYKHSFEVARSGKRLSGDDFLNKCKKEEAEISDMKLSEGFKAGMESYCTPERGFEVGFTGQPFNYEFCDSDKKNKISQRHTDGVNKYCEKDNAYRIGAEGKVYTGICSPEKETRFLPEFRKGRKVFLQGQIEDKTSTIGQIEKDITSKQYERSQLMAQLSFLPNSNILVRQQVWDNNTKKYTDQYTYQQDPNVASRRNQLNWSMQNIDQQIQQLQQKRETLSTEILDHKKELRTLN